MQRLAAGIGRKVAVPAGLGLGAASSSNVGVAHADAPASSPVGRHAQDTWTLVEPGDKLLFAPEELDAAFHELGLALKPTPPSPACLIEEAPSDEPSSDGSLDALIERSSWGGSSSTAVLPLEADELCSLASRLLRAPGVQREIVVAALADPEVFDILAARVDLPSYLEGQGFAARGLLVGTSAASSLAEAEADLAGGSSEAANPLTWAARKAADGLDSLGSGFAQLARWVRAQLQDRLLAGEAQGGGAASGARRAAAPSPARRLHRMLGGATCVMVAVIVACLLKRPAALKGLLRRVG